MDLGSCTKMLVSILTSWLEQEKCYQIEGYRTDFPQEIRGTQGGQNRETDRQTKREEVKSYFF